MTDPTQPPVLPQTPPTEPTEPQGPVPAPHDDIDPTVRPEDIDPSVPSTSADEVPMGGEDANG